MNLTNLPSYPYITGDSFRGVCGWVLDEFGWRNQPGLQNCIFVKIGFLNTFRIKYIPKSDFILFTHNGDYPVREDDVSKDIASRNNLQRWYGQNVLFEHPKITPIPIGLTNRRNPHYSDPRVITKTTKLNLVRDNLVYANYNFMTNKKEREYCADQTQVKPITGLDFESYLRDLCSSRFVISPNGNGIDCHRTWESLYCGASPICTPYALFAKMKLPVLVVQDWREYRRLELSNALHDSLWANFDPSILRIDGFLRHLGLV